MFIHVLEGDQVFAQVAESLTVLTDDQVVDRRCTAGSQYQLRSIASWKVLEISATEVRLGRRQRRPVHFDGLVFVHDDQLNVFFIEVE